MIDGNETSEVWTIIPAFPDYAISTFGRIKSLERSIDYAWEWGKVTRVRPEKIMKTPLDSHGYPHLNLRKDGETFKAKVHRLVALTFIGEPPPNQEILHIDGDSTNCRLNNLRYGTRSENIFDAIRHGPFPKGENKSNAKLTVQKVRDICTSKESAKVLAERYGVNKSYISHIRTGLCWREATEGFRNGNGKHGGADWYIRRGKPVPACYTETVIAGTSDT